MTGAIWVVTDGAAGNERQALALARALPAAEAGDAPAPEPMIWRLRAHAPWKQAAPRRLPGSEHAFGKEFRKALLHPPRLAVGCGRQGALATRLLREAGARVVQILDPRIPPRHWDAIVVPEHDRLRGPNVVTLLGSLHEIDAPWLAKARARFPHFERLPEPRILLLLGAPIRNVPLDAGWWKRTAEAVRALHDRLGGSISICGSRRTPTWLAEAARSAFAGPGPGLGVPGLRWFGARDGENPYAGLLAWSDRIIVSPDSVNMLSEACATGARVRIAEPEIARGRHATFLSSLMLCSAAGTLDPEITFAPSTVLHELPRIAAILRERLGV